MKSKNSLYADYIKERAGAGIVETKFGFATFSYMVENIVYIQDVYVKPKYRKKGIAKSFADKICNLAIKEGKSVLLASIDASARGSEVSLKVFEAYGMAYYKTAGNLHYFVKQIAPIKEVEKPEPVAQEAV